MDGFLNFLFHLDDWLQQLMYLHPLISYFLIFSIVFAESAFFPAAPFLPGDGLLFTIGVLAAGKSLSLLFTIPVLILGGILGTRFAFILGRKTGTLLLKKYGNSHQKLIKQAYDFYHQHGNVAFLFSRFLPIIRAIIPLIAGIANMDNRLFWRFTALSVSLWVGLITLVGYKLGHLPAMKHYFGLIILGISAVSLTTIAIVAIRQAAQNRKKV